MKAVACTIQSLERHPNADRLQVAVAAGTQVIVGQDAKVGDLGILVPAGAQLSAPFCLANRLFRKHPQTGEPLGGYLDERGRVVALRLRGVNSEGLFLATDCLHAPMTAEAGEEIDTWRDGVFVTKYIGPAARAAISRQAPSRSATQSLPRHYDTAQVRHNTYALCHALSDGALLTVTEKLHGTSGRTGSVPVERGRVSRVLVSAWNSLAGRVGLPRFRTHVVVSGTRNCILDPSAPGEMSAGYRLAVHSVLAPCVRPGEVWYYEIVGFDDAGKPIMAPHNLDSDAFDRPMRKRLIDTYGKTVVYAYGCEPTAPPFESADCFSARQRVFVYRITTTAADGAERELNRREIEARVLEVPRGNARGGPPVFVVPEVAIYEGGRSEASLLAALDELTRGMSFVGRSFREGICVRAEWPDGRVGRAYKHKSFVFAVCEGIAANDVGFVDLEDVS